MTINLKDFHNMHTGKDIYVIGSGPSCDYIDPSFFYDKITIGINQVYKKYNTKYIVKKDHNLLQQTLDNYQGIILVSKKHAAYHEEIDISKYKNIQNLCVYDHLPNKEDIDLSTFDKENYLCVSHSTITTGIHFAYYLGARNILLVGADHGLLNNKMNFDDYYTDIKEIWQDNWDEYKKWVKTLDSSTIKICEKIRSLGINVHSINPFINFRLENNKYE
jgi:hypothetical protein